VKNFNTGGNVVLENIDLLLANFLGGGLMLLIGLVLRFVQGSEGLIAGYNTSSKTEKEKWNATAMRIFLGKTFILSSCVLLIAGVLILLNIYPNLSMIVSWSVFTVAIISCVIYMNISSKFKTQQK
jgi:hypothetical protein